MHRVGGFLVLAWTSFLMREISRSRFLISLCCFLTRAKRLSLLVASVVLFNTSCFRTPFLLVAAAARLMK